MNKECYPFLCKFIFNYLYILQNILHIHAHTHIQKGTIHLLLDWNIYDVISGNGMIFLLICTVLHCLGWFYLFFFMFGHFCRFLIYYALGLTRFQLGQMHVFYFLSSIETIKNEMQRLWQKFWWDRLLCMISSNWLWMQRRGKLVTGVVWCFFQFIYYLFYFT